MGIDSLLLKFHSDFLKTEERDWMHVETESLAANGLAQSSSRATRHGPSGKGLDPLSAEVCQGQASGREKNFHLSHLCLDTCTMSPCLALGAFFVPPGSCVSGKTPLLV